jgi:hypothetical protein
MNGTNSMKISQAAFFPPPMSCRRKMSDAMTIRSQNQATQAKKTSIVQSTSRKG